MCDQQMLRPDCAYAQSDQSICYSLECSMNIKLLTEQHLDFLSLKVGCTCSSETTLVKIPHCWKSRVAAQLYLAQIVSLAEQFNLSVTWSHKTHGRFFRGIARSNYV